MTEEALRTFRDRFELEISDEEVREHRLPPARPTTRRRCVYLHERREELGGHPARSAGPGREARRARRSTRSPRQLEGTGEREISSTMAFVRILAALLRDKTARAARRADRGRRVAHVRHGGDVPPARDLLPGRPALPARGRRAAHVLQGGQEGPDPPGGDQRGGRVLVLDGRGDVVRQPRRADDARSTSTTRCSASSAWATSPGRPATRGPAASSSAAPRGGRR